MKSLTQNKVNSKKWIILFSFIFLVFYIFAFDNDQTETKAKKILIIGDSLSAAYNIDETKAWPQLLEQRLHADNPDHILINKSINGDTTRSGIERLPELLEVHKPDIVIIALGGNDALRHYSTVSIRENLESMVQLSQKNYAKVLLCAIRLPAHIGPIYRKAYRNVFSNLAEEYETGLIPFMLKGISDNPRMMQSDGIHPRQKAQSFILDNVWQGLSLLL